MYRIEEDGAINVTRGDALVLVIEAIDEDTGMKYTFQKSDVLRLNVFGKKKCEEVVLSLDFTVGEEAAGYTMEISGDDTKIGECINKPKDYWYEIELNPDDEMLRQTIVGYDENGPKVFRLYPEGYVI